jgi:DNA-binding NarL/FixJ family response regulator
MSKKRSSTFNRTESPQNRNFLSKADVGHWLQRLYRNTYTRGGRQLAVKNWSVKIQVNGRRRAFSLAGSDRNQAASEALQIYQTIIKEGWDAVTQNGRAVRSAFSTARSGKTEMERSDAKYWKRKLVKRPYPAFLSENEREFTVFIEHGGAGHYFPLGTNAVNDAAKRAAQIYHVVRKRGWEIAGRMYPRELAVALRWFDNPVAWTYTTLFTWRTAPVHFQNDVPCCKGRRIALVEPDSGLRISFASNLSSQEGFCCCFSCSNVEEMAQAMRRQPVDLVLVNSCFREVPETKQLLPKGNLSAISEAHLPSGGAKKNATMCVFYSVFEDADQLFKRTPGGAIGYMLKRTPLNLLLSPIALSSGPLTHKQAALKIRKYFQELVYAMPSVTTVEGLVKLTPREREILSQLAKGRVTKEIASTLSISSWTVNGHVKSIFAKLKVHTRTEAVVRYLEPVN